MANLMTAIASSLLNLMTLFLRPKMHRDNVADGRMFAGALFFAISMVTFNGMAEIAMTIQNLPVFYKQRNFFFPYLGIYMLFPYGYLKSLLMLLK
ncbi:hypothetical protein ACS0TY_035007 [Phlomoides rotata]